MSLRKLEISREHFIQSTIKDRNGMDLTKQKILRRGGNNTQNCKRKVFMAQITMMM